MSLAPLLQLTLSLASDDNDDDVHHNVHDDIDNINNKNDVNHDDVDDNHRDDGHANGGQPRSRTPSRPLRPALAA